MKRWIKLSVLLLCVSTASSSYAWKSLTVSKADSLATIAEKYRPSGVTRMDMVIAIRNANPRVFAKASSLKPGIKLIVPTNAVEVRDAIKGKYPAMSSVAPQTDTANAKDKSDKSANKNLNKADTVKADKTVAAKTAPAKPKPTPVIKKVAAPAPAANDSSMTIKSLQDTVSSQTQAIQNYQGQINQLTGQLNIANQQIQSLQNQVNQQGLWTWANLWLALWIATMALLLIQYRRYRQLLNGYDDEPVDEQEELDEHLQAEEELNEQHVEEERSEIVEEQQPLFGHDTEAEFGQRFEPQLNAEEIPHAAANNNWEQVELDIPVAEPSVHEQVEPELGMPEFENFEDKELAGQQQDIIEALSQDEDNMEWHQALLEFYVKTNSQNSFKRHYLNMVKKGIMSEGDPLWEEVRKMYLNKWIYQAI